MDGSNDFDELLASFNAHRVEYLIVGAHALAFHGAPRSTGDFDILVKPSPENARRVMAALADFGFGSVGLTPEDFQQVDRVVQLGVAPMRIDLMTSITGVSSEQAFAGCVRGTSGTIPVAYLGRAELVANKRATGRPRDLADLDALGEH